MGYTASMKTTIEIRDDLLRAAKSTAAKQGVPLREFVEVALEERVQRLESRKPYKFQDLSFKGEGLREGVTWDRLLDYAYEEDSKS